MEKTFLIKKIRSSIGCTHSQRATLEALGLRKINSTIVMKDNPANRGQIQKVSHLVTVTVQKGGESTSEKSSVPAAEPVKKNSTPKAEKPSARTT